MPDPLEALGALETLIADERRTLARHVRMYQAASPYPTKAELSEAVDQADIKDWIRESDNYGESVWHDCAASARWYAAHPTNDQPPWREVVPFAADNPEFFTPVGIVEMQMGWRIYPGPPDDPSDKYDEVLIKAVCLFCGASRTYWC